MKFLELKEKIKSKLFTFSDVQKIFHNESEINLKLQLSRFFKKKLIFRIKKGLYCFEKDKVNELIIANYLYQPSYISLYTALFYHGVIIDIPQKVTSITTTRPKKIKTSFGDFYYYKINKKLYFGFEKFKIGDDYVDMAKKEKALLDFFYIFQIKKIDDLRLNLERIDFNLYREYAKSFPRTIQKII